MNKTLYILLVIFSVTILISCNQKGSSDIMCIEQGKIIYTELEATHDYNEVSVFLRDNTHSSFVEKYQVQYYKTVNSIDYTVIKTTNGYCLVFFGDDNAQSSIQKIVFSDAGNQNKLQSLSVGSTLEEVRAADPTGQYDFLYASQSEFPQISYHYFISGDCYCIEYSDGIISNILYFTI